MITAWVIFPRTPTRPAHEVQGRLWTSPAGITWLVIDKDRTRSGHLLRYRLGVSVFLTEAMANKARIGRCAKKLTPANRYSLYKGLDDEVRLKAVVGNHKVFKGQL